MKKIEEYVRNIPDFPEKGIIFRDVTTVLQDAEGLKLAIDSMLKLLEGIEFDVRNPGDLFSECRLLTRLASRLFPFAKRESFPAKRFPQSMIWNMEAQRLKCTGIP